ncbi:hypothetical protein OUZ56_025994 [Daphnia magna]|uniref:Uncharacterized protein n=1 Tax=Daphnia magna TaxID=35525 RepID=A0ABQ9ZKJ1_9CRUS|nr:hypothetical protein OUZ56_025994 [Daphnia magna]
MAFKPYGSPPAFDLDDLSTIDTALDEDARGVYKAHTLLSCLSTDTLQAVLSIGFTDAQLNDHSIVIGHLRPSCNAGRNRHVWCRQFSAKKQGVQQAADDWLCELQNSLGFVCTTGGWTLSKSHSQAMRLSI